MEHDSVIDSSRKPKVARRTTESFLLTKEQKRRVDAIIEKHALDRVDFYRNCVMAQVENAEKVDKEDTSNNE